MSRTLCGGGHQDVRIAICDDEASQRDYLRQQVEGWASRLQTAPRMILFRKGSGYLRIPADEIYYAEAFSHSVTVVTRNRKETFTMRLSGMEELLGEGFFHCHRSYIVSMKHVRRVTRTGLILDNGVEIPLSRNLYDAANQAFIKTYF